MQGFAKIIIGTNVQDLGLKLYNLQVQYKFLEITVGDVKMNQEGYYVSIFGKIEKE